MPLSTRTNKSADEDDPIIGGLRLCRVSSKPVYGHNANLNLSGVPIYYQCSGEPYFNFTNKMYNMIRNKHIQNPGSMWGKRPWPIPLDVGMTANSNSNLAGSAALLFMGNSHARQVTNELLCQYQDKIVSNKVLFDETSMRKNVMMQFHLQNNLTIYTAFNVPHVYYAQLQKTFETMFRRPLQSLDAIVMGSFHSYETAAHSTFAGATMKYQKKFPEQKIDFEHILPPNIKDIAKLYDGPIVYLSMFSSTNDRRKEYSDALKVIQELEENERTLPPSMRALSCKI